MSALPNTHVEIWGLRKEAREAWDYVRRDELVYFTESCLGNLEQAHVFPKHYLQRDLWLEIHWTTIGFDEREMHFQSIVEYFDKPMPLTFAADGTIGKNEFDRGSVDRYGSMLVEYPEFIELPEQVIHVGIPSIERLKPVELSCHCGWKQLSQFVVPGVPFLEDKKMDIAPLFVRKAPPESESPSKLIKRRSKTADKVTERQGDNVGDAERSDPANMQIPIKIIFVTDGVGFRRNPVVKFPPKHVEVFLRPTGLHFHIQ
jgi:hypothetical protein